MPRASQKAEAFESEFTKRSARKAFVFLAFPELKPTSLDRDLAEHALRSLLKIQESSAPYSKTGSSFGDEYEPAWKEIAEHLQTGDPLHRLWSDILAITKEDNRN